MTNSPDYYLEPMDPQNGPDVIEIYNYFIVNSLAAYSDQTVPASHFEKFWQMIRGYPALTVKLEGGKVIGFGFLHPYRPIRTMQHTAEITYFILPEYTGRGIGKRLLDFLEDAAPAFGVQILLASIASANQQSLNFHIKHGFRECGRFKQVIRKNDREFDMVWMQKRLV